MITEFRGAARPFCKDDVLRAANAIGCDPAAIAAVVHVEAAGAPFLTDHRPKALYEAHVHGRETGYRFCHVLDPNGKAISARRWDRSLYGKAGAWQYVRLDVSMKLGWEAALKATSLGAFQILGRNYELAGFRDLEAFVRAQMESAGRQLDSFVAFVKNNRLDDELRDRRWTDFARGYNGSGYAANQYDVKLKTAFKDLVKTWQTKYVACGAIGLHEEPGLDQGPTRAQIRIWQALLNVEVPTHGLVTDGWWGPKTEAALKAFQNKVGLAETGEFDPDTVEQLEN